MLKIKKPDKSLLFVVALLAAVFVLFGWLLLIDAPLIPSNHDPVSFVFSKGSSLTTLSNQLHDAGVLRHPKIFIFLAKINGSATKLKAGEYSIEPGLRPTQLLEKMIKGEMVLHGFTIVPGWTFNQVISHLNSDAYISHTLEKMSSSQIMDKLGYKNTNPEGLFYPSTYNFSGPTTDLEVLQRAYDLMQNKLTDLWQNRDSNLPYKTPYQALVVASMIEREAAVDEEREIISGVIYNRLHRNMQLAIDPTVIYGLGSIYHGHLTHELIRKKTPYNTYINYGLPPTPICMPGEPSIYAALHPHPSDYLYYVSKNDGTHVFSPNYKQHAAAVAKYQPKSKKTKK